MLCMLSMLCVVCCVLCVVCCVLCVVCCMLYVVCCMLYVVCCMLYIVYCTLYVACCTLYVVRCTLYVVRCTLYVVRCTLYVVRCTLYILWYCIIYFYIDKDFESDMKGRFKLVTSLSDKCLLIYFFSCRQVQHWLLFLTLEIFFSDLLHCNQCYFLCN